LLGNISVRRRNNGFTDVSKKIKLAGVLVFATIDSREALQIENISAVHYEPDAIYFYTTRGKNFCQELLADGRVQFLCYTKYKEMIRLSGKAYAVSDGKSVYEKYLLWNQEFPHEMGLLLGYPVEDIKGYILNRVENCLYTGYWKVYGNLTEKMILFRQFEKARDVLLELLPDGISIVEVVQEHLLVQNV